MRMIKVMVLAAMLMGVCATSADEKVIIRQLELGSGGQCGAVTGSCIVIEEA
jgi:hypothetical protein